MVKETRKIWGVSAVLILSALHASPCPAAVRSPRPPFPTQRTDADDEQHSPLQT